MCPTCRGRKELQPVVSFLTARVKDCNKNNYCKLRRLMNYMHYIKDKITIAGTDSAGALHSFAGTSHAD